MAFAKMPAVMRSSQLETGLFSPDGGARLSLAPLDRGEDPASHWLVAGSGRYLTDQYAQTRARPAFPSLNAA